MAKEIEASYAPPDESFKALLFLLENQPPEEWHKGEDHLFQFDLKKNDWDKNEIISNPEYSDVEKGLFLRIAEGQEKRISEIPENIKSVLILNQRIQFNTVIKIGGKEIKFEVEKLVSQEKLIYNKNYKEEIYPAENTYSIYVADVKSDELLDNFETDEIEPVFNSIEKKFNTYHNQK